jgi:5-methylcytosine-specific restriction enzyme A
MFHWLNKVYGAVTGRSSKWPAVRARHLREQSNCRVCGTTEDVEAHHLKPFHQHPELELDPSNLITLCRDHHLLFGHLMNWQSINCNCLQDCHSWRKKIAARP